MSHLLYALPIVVLKPSNWANLERDHTAAARTWLGLPSPSPIAATLAEAGAWPAQLRVERAGLNYVERLHRVPDGAALLQRLRSRPHSTAGRLVAA